MFVAVESRNDSRETPGKTQQAQGWIKINVEENGCILTCESDREINDRERIESFAQVCLSTSECVELIQKLLQEGLLKIDIVASES